MILQVIAMKIHDYWKDHSEILYPRSSRSYMWLYYNEIARKRLQTLQEENIKQLSYMIYMMNKTKKRRNEKMINTITKTDNTDKKKRHMKDQKRKEMSVSDHGIFSLSKRQRPKQNR